MSLACFKYEHTSMKTLVITACLIIGSDREKTPVPTAVVDEEGGRLLGRVQTVHYLHPEIDHFNCLVAGTQLPDILIQ